MSEHTDDLDRIEAVLADLGTIVRRAGAETLSEEEFHGFASRARRNLIALRASLRAERETDIEGGGGFELTGLGLTTLGQALSDSADQRRASIKALASRIDGLMTGADLAALPQGTARARVCGTLIVIDGGRS